MKIIVQSRPLMENAKNTREVSALNKKLMDWAWNLQNITFFGVQDIEPKDQEIIIEVFTCIGY